MFRIQSLNHLGLFFAITMLFSMGCKKPEPTGGIELIPGEDQLFPYRTDTLTLTASTWREDSLRTDELSSTLIGAYTDPEFGMAQAWGVSQVRLSTSSAEFPVVYEIDSVVLTIQYDGYLYGRQGIPYFIVNEITEDLVLSENYYSNKKLSVAPDNLMRDGMERVELNVPPTAENSASFPPLRLHLDESLGQRLLTPADPEALTSDANFREYFKGVQISTLAEPNTGIFNADLVDPASKLTVYYRDLDGAEPDTTSYSFNITSDCARFTRFEHGYTGTALNGVEDGSVDGSSLCYIQAGAGLKVRIDIPYLLSLNAFDRRTLNAAELIIPFEADTRFSPPSQLVLLYQDQNGAMQILPDQASQTIGGLGDFVKKEYRFRIERFVQRVLNGDINPDGLYLYSTRGGVSVNRVICRGPEYNPEILGENMRLVVTFTSD
jgi:hypothetical protein